MPAPPQLTDLVARFREHLPDYHAGNYNEAQLRHDFLDTKKPAIFIKKTSHPPIDYGARTAHHKTLIQRQIDALVYELYGLTEEEIRIVEAGNATG